MMTDVYQHVRHQATVAELVEWAAAEGLPIMGVDNLPGAEPLETAVLPERCVLLFGQEGPGLSPEARAAASQVLFHLPSSARPAPSTPAWPQAWLCAPRSAVGLRGHETDLERCRRSAHAGRSTNVSHRCGRLFDAIRRVVVSRKRRGADVGETRCHEGSQ